MEDFNEFYKKQYSILHELEKQYFAGFQSLFMKNYMKSVCSFFKIKNILDYGCGKGFQYLLERQHKEWGVEKIYLYDIGVSEYSVKPQKGTKFDAVLCFDVLEHIRENHLDYILEDVYSYADKIVVFTISTRPAKKELPNGENAHLTVKSKEWWNDKLISMYNKLSLKLKTIAIYEVESTKEQKRVDQYFINFSDKEKNDILELINEASQ